jgi:hypothetical protein
VAQSTTKVVLQGTYIKGRIPDLPTMIILPELIEPAINFKQFITLPDNEVGHSIDINTA